MRQDIYSYTYFHLQLYYTDVVKFGKGIYSLAYLKNVLSKFINKNDIKAICTHCDYFIKIEQNLLLHTNMLNQLKM